MSDAVQELAKQAHEAQTKHVDFLMALAAAGIGLAVTRTSGKSPEWPMLIVAVGVLSWACCIMFGIRNRTLYQIKLINNVALLRAGRGELPEAGDDPARIAAALAVLQGRMDEGNKWAIRYYHWQTYAFVFGVLCFLIWHVVEMFTRGS